MENSIVPVKQSNSGVKTFLAVSWLISVVLAAFIGFIYGQTIKPTQTKNVLMAATEITSTVAPSSSITPTLVNTTCKKTGLAQKWEYLTPYIIKDKDSLQSIVTAELKDATRVSEVMQLNESGQLVVGSTLYLPPPSITKSSGKIKQAHGKIIKKNASFWHLNFNSEEEGLGVLIPTFWFDEITNKDVFNVGDCVTIIFDDGYKVFSVTQQ